MGSKCFSAFYNSWLRIKLAREQQPFCITRERFIYDKESMYINLCSNNIFLSHYIFDEGTTWFVWVGRDLYLLTRKICEPLPYNNTFFSHYIFAKKIILFVWGEIYTQEKYVNFCGTNIFFLIAFFLRNNLVCLLLPPRPVTAGDSSLPRVILYSWSNDLSDIISYRVIKKSQASLNRHQPLELLLRESRCKA